MGFVTSSRRLAKTRPWALELIIAAVGLLLGIALMPVLIYYAGVEILGRFEGASLGHLYASLLAGLAQGSTAAWVVLLGPYGLYVLGKGLRGWWRAAGRFN